MTIFPRFTRAAAAAALLCAALIAPANGLISAEALSVVKGWNTAPSGSKGKQMATLHSYLLTNAVTIGLAPDEDPDEWKTDALQRSIDVWSAALPDSPFVLAKPGEKASIMVRFVRSIGSSGDVQGQVEATRFLRWGSSVSYRLEANLQVKMTTGRRNLRDEEVTEVIAHELGHVLGLDDNEECVGLMGPFVPGKARCEPSREEIRAVVQYRDQLRDAIARMSNNR